MSNAINSIAGIDDFADAMKKNLEHKHKLLEFVRDIATGSFAYYKVKAIELLEEIEADND